MGQGEENWLGRGPHAPGPDEKARPLTVGQVRGPRENKDSSGPGENRVNLKGD